MNLVEQMNNIPQPISPIQTTNATTNTAISNPVQVAGKVYNQYACIRCRRLKKKCSKELPRCANCERQGETCEYVERKNKRKSSISNNSVSIIKLKKSCNSNKTNNVLDANITTNNTIINNNDNNHSSEHDYNMSSSISSNENTDNEVYDAPIALTNSNNVRGSGSNSISSNLSDKSISLTSDYVQHRRTISNPGKFPCLPNLKSEYNYNCDSSTSVINTPQLMNPVLLSPNFSNIRTTPIIQLPPIRRNSLNHQNIDSFPSLDSYSLQHNNKKEMKQLNKSPLLPLNHLDKTYESTLLPSLPKQLMSMPPQTPPTNTQVDKIINPTAISSSSTRKQSITSISPTSSLQRSDTFLIPSKQKVINNDHLQNDVNSSKYIPNNSNGLFDPSPTYSIEQDILLFIFNKIGFVDENIYLNAISNTNLDTKLTVILKFFIFLDNKIMMNKLEEYKKESFNWHYISSHNIKDSEDYFSSIEFLLLYTSAILLNNQNKGNDNINTCDHKIVYTMALKMFQKRCFPITRVQILKLMMLLQIVSLVGDSDLDIPWFIQSNLSQYTLKWKVNRNLKQLKLIGVTLSEIEYTNRLFWSVFIVDSLISTTLGHQSCFLLNDIDVPLPIAITKDEEDRIIIQSILINMSKIQTRIISQLYVANAKFQINSDAERFAILSDLRQEADMWYNECRLLLIKLPQLFQDSISSRSRSNSGSNSNDLSDRGSETFNCDLNLQNFAAWISQEYYYTLTQLFKSSNLFPKPDIPNFTVISNATYQNAIILNNLVTNRNLPNSSFILYRFAHTSLSAITSIYKGMFTISECKQLIETMLNLWRNGDDDLSKCSYECILKLGEILSSDYPNLNNSAEKYIPLENNARLILDLIKNFTSIMEQHGFLVSVDRDYLETCGLKE